MPDRFPPRFARTVGLYGPDAFARIRRRGALVVGLGGVGAHCVVALARSGIGRLKLVDFDRVTTSSLNRHPVAGPGDVGRLKTEILAAWIAATCPDTLTADRGLDRALAVLDWLKSRPELEPRIPDGIAALFDIETDATDVLYLGDLVELDLLLDDLVKDWRLRDVLVEAGALLRNLGLKVRLAVTARQTAGATRLIVCDRSNISDIDADLDGEIVSLDELAGAAGVGDTPFRFRITQDERRALVARLKASGSRSLRAGPHELAQLRMLTRQGTWQENRYAEPAVSFGGAVEVER